MTENQFINWSFGLQEKHITQEEQSNWVTSLICIGVVEVTLHIKDMDSSLKYFEKKACLMQRLEM